MTTLLRLSGVTKTVRVPDAEPLTILHGVDLVVDLGERVSVVGRSGSGKSTLLNILGLLDSPSSGVFEFEGVPVERIGGRRATCAAAPTSASSSSSSTSCRVAPRSRTS